MGIKVFNADFYPRSPCGERLPYAKKFGFCDLISIHALLAESDILNPFKTFIILSFLSTLSLRRATLAPRLADMSAA